MDRLKRKLGFYIMAGMLMLSTVLGIGLLSRSGGLSSTQASVTESVDDDLSNENGEDKEISAQAATLTGQTYTSQFTITGDTIFDNCYFEAGTQFTTTNSWNVSFKDCYFASSNAVSSGSDIIYDGELTFSNCIFELKSPYLVSVYSLAGATINFRDCWVNETVSGITSYILLHNFCILFKLGS